MRYVLAILYILGCGSAAMSAREKGCDRLIAIAVGMMWPWVVVERVVEWGFDPSAATSQAKFFKVCRE